MTKVNLVIFGTNCRFKQTKNRLANQAKESGWFNKILVYDNKVLVDIANRFGAPSEIKLQLEEYKEKHLIHQNFWWKPGLILKAVLDECEQDDILLYLDAGCSLNFNGKERFDYYIDLCKTGPGFVGFGANKIVDLSSPEFPFEKMHTKRDVLKLFNLDEPEILLSSQITGGVFFVRKNSFALDIIEKWQRYSTVSFLFNNDISVNEEYPEFKGHKHDQSILSLLIKSRWQELNNYLLPHKELAIDHDPKFIHPIKVSRVRDSDIHTWKWEFPNKYKSQADYIEPTIFQKFLSIFKL